MSLQSIRKHSNSLVVKGLLGLLVLSFAAWGVGDFVTGGRDSTALKVNGERVSVYELQRAYQTKKSEMQRQLQGAALTPELIKMFRLQDTVVREALQNAMLKSYASDMGLTVPDEMVAEAIKIQPQFQGPDGTFDQALYQNALTNAGYSTEAFEALVREDLLRQHVRHPFLGLTFNNEKALKRFSDQLNQVRDVRAILVTPRDVAAPAAPTDEELKALYEELKTNYTTQEYRAFDVVMLDLAEMVSSLDVDTAMAEEHYNSNKSLYALPERRDVSQSIFSTKEEAEAAIASNTFDAKQSIGLVARGELPLPEMDDAVFDLAEGAHTDVIETPFGFSVVHVHKIAPAHEQTFAEVKDQIMGSLKRDMAESVFEDTLERVHDLIAGASNLKDVASENKRIRLQSFSKVSISGETVDGKSVSIPGGDALLSAVFSAEEGTMSDEIQVGDDKIAFIEVTSITPSRIKDMAEIESDLVAEHKKRSTEKAMMTKAQTILVERGRGDAFEGLVTKYDLAEPIQTVPALKRSGAQRNTLISDASRAAIFAVPFKAGNVTVLDMPHPTANGNIALFEVTNVNVAEPTNEQMSNFSNMVNQAMAQDLFTQFMQHLNATAKVDMRKRMIETALSETN